MSQPEIATARHEPASLLDHDVVTRVVKRCRDPSRRRRSRIAARRRRALSVFTSMEASGVRACRLTHVVPSCIKTTDEEASCSYSTKRGSALCTPYGDAPNKGGPITRGLARFDRSRRHTHPPRLAVGAAEDRPVSATSRLRPSRPMRCGGSSSPSSSWGATPMITLSSFGSTARRPIPLVPDGKDMSVCLRDRSTST